jgi:predicted anti-sigma-YlaC factor YlaD
MSDHNTDIACIDVVQLLSDYLEGRLTREMTSRVEEHLKTCDGCERYLDQLRTTIEVAGLLREEDIDPEARVELLAAFRTFKSR